MTYASGRPLIEPFNISLYDGGFFLMDVIAFIILTVMVIQTSLYRDRGRRDDRIFYYMLLCLMVSAFFDAAEYFVGFIISTRDNVYSETLSLISYLFLRAVPAMLILYFEYKQHRSDELLKKRAVFLGIVGGISDILLITSFFMFVRKGEFGDNVGHGPETVVFFAGIAVSMIYEILILAVLYKNNKKLLIFVLLPLVLVLIMLMPVGVMVYTVILVFVHIDEMNRNFYEERRGT